MPRATKVRKQTGFIQSPFTLTMLGSTAPLPTRTVCTIAIAIILPPLLLLMLLLLKLLEQIGDAFLQRLALATIGGGGRLSAQTRRQSMENRR